MLGRTTLLATALVLAAPLGYAQAGDYGRPGIYAGVQLATGTSTRFREKFERNTGAEGGRVDTAVGAGARIGFRIASRIAAECQLEWIPGFDYTKNTTSMPDANTTVSRDQDLVEGDLWVVTGNVKYYLLHEGRFQPYALGGVGYMGARTDQLNGPQGVRSDVFAARLGLGFDAYLTDWLLAAIDAHYVIPTQDLQDLDYVGVSVGLQYRF